MFELNFHPFSITPNFGWLPQSLEICCRIISELSRDVSRHANSSSSSSSNSNHSSSSSSNIVAVFYPLWNHPQIMMM